MKTRKSRQTDGVPATPERSNPSAGDRGRMEAETPTATPLSSRLQSISWTRRQISAVNSEHLEFPPRSFVSTFLSLMVSKQAVWILLP